MINDALTALKEGKVILLYDFDNREKETDFAILSSAVTPETIRMFRKDGGGLICTAISGAAAAAFGLPFASDALKFAGDIVEKEGDVPYDRMNHSSFSLWVNHRDTYTGVTDRDRALTVTSIARQVENFTNQIPGPAFSEEFRTPGHMALLRAADKLLDQRRGQTELSVALAEMLGVPPAITICEMMADTGYALDKEGAKAYAREHGLVFIEGQEVLDAWEQRKSHSS